MTRLFALIALLAVAYAVFSQPAEADDPVILKPDNIRIVERDTVDLWCGQGACSTVSGDTVRLRWRIPKNTSRFQRTYKLVHLDGNSLLTFQTITRDSGAKQMTWRTEFFQQHRNQRIILLAALLQQPPFTIVSDLAPQAHLALTQGGSWSIYAWVDECKRRQWPCRAPVSYLSHRW